MSALFVLLCLFVFFGLLAFIRDALERVKARKAKPHPLATVTPLRTGHVRVVEPQHTPRRWMS